MYAVVILRGASKLRCDHSGEVDLSCTCVQTSVIMTCILFVCIVRRPTLCVQDGEGDTHVENSKSYEQ